MTTDIVDAQVVEDEPGTDITPADQQPSGTLFRTDDPVEIIDKATQVADALRGILTKQRLTKRIGDKDHVLVEGWTTLGSMLGVVPVCTWTRKLDNGWEARVEARTLDGRTVGAAEAECLRSERMWAKRDDYALRSMAQTRATSKALRAPLGWIVTLAGYEATPAEEMPAQPSPRGSEPSTGAAGPTHRNGREDPAAPQEDYVTREQYSTIVAAFSEAGAPVKKLADFLGCEATSAAVAEYCTPEAQHLTKERANEVIMFLRGIAQ